MFKGMVGFVTGAASGLGKGTANHIIKHGGSVLMCDLPSSQGHAVAEKLGSNAVYVPCDITSEKELQNAFDICKEKFESLNFVVNCAALARSFQLLSPVKKEILHIQHFDTVIKTNLYGAFNVLRLASAMLSQNTPNEDGQRGVIVMAGGSWNYDGMRGQSILAAAGGALQSMILPAARDLASLGIRVNSIPVAFAETPLADENILSLPVKQYFEAQMLCGERFATPEEFAQTVANIVFNPMLNGTDVRITSGMRHFFSPV